MKKITLMLIMLITANIVTAQNWNPRHPGWTDSFAANGFCWCNSSNFDHNLDSKTLNINGTNYNIVDVCEELENHPSYRSFQNGDAPYNDIQCGNGPANDADDEVGCPGRTDLGSKGCDQIGPTFDMVWLESRSKFGGDTTTTTTKGTVVHITKRNAPEFAIDGGSGGTNAQNVTLSAANTSDEGQLWVEIDRGNGYYSYEKYGTNFSLDGNSEGANNQSIYLWETSDTNQNQQWQKVAVGDGGYKLLKSNASGFAINGGSGGLEGRDINLWDSTSTSQDLQWYITPIVTDIRIEAEDYDTMSGIQTQDSSEGTENVGWIENGDWTEYNNVDLTGLNTFTARVASNTAGGTIEIRTGSSTGTLIGLVSVSNTGGNQNWRTVNTSITSTNGKTDVYLVFKGGEGFLFNINWLEFSSNTDTVLSNEEFDKQINQIVVYPNPVFSTTTIENAANATVTIYAMDSSVLFTQTISSESEILDLSGLATGIYFADVKGATSLEVIKVVKE